MDRIAPTFILSEGKLFQTKQYKKNIYLGCPINSVKIFAEKNVSENVIIDQSTKTAGIDIDLIARMASYCRAPVCYGGGVNSLRQIEDIISCGCERVLLSSSLQSDHKFLSEAIDNFGASSIAICIEIHDINDLSTNFTDSRLTTLIDEINEVRVSEVILSDVSNSGMMTGLRTKRMAPIFNKINVPTAISGGCCSLNDAKAALQNGYSSVLCSTLLNIYGPYNAVLPYYFE